MSKPKSAPPKAVPLAAPGAAGPPPISPDCRARPLPGIENFSECLTPAPGNCPFLFIYGHGRFCTHPLREQIPKPS